MRRCDAPGRPRPLISHPLSPETRSDETWFCYPLLQTLSALCTPLAVLPKNLIHAFQYDIVEPEGRGHPLPLFVHANLLKHLGSLAPSGTASAFTIIKRAVDDMANARSLDAVRAYVYNTHGMCTDMEVYEDESKKGKGGAGGQTIIEEDFETAYEGRFAKWYEQVYAKYGGKKGGW